jgi:hypothetical protein
MDAPVDDVAAVNLEITAIWLKAEGDDTAIQLPLSETPFITDLLELTNDAPALLVENALIEAGSYEWLRMDVNADIDQMTDDSHVVGTDQGIYELFVPSGRVQLVGGFEVGEAESVELLFDWDVRSGLVHPPGLGGRDESVYLLKPTIRVVGVLLNSTLRGTIAMSTVIDVANNCNADSEVEMNFDEGNTVYLFAGHDIVPDDLDEEMDVTPLATFDATPNEAGDYTYSTSLDEGDYTVAFTCQARNDMPDADDTIQFLPTTHNITVDGTAAEITADF